MIPFVAIVTVLINFQYFCSIQLSMSQRKFDEDDKRIKHTSLTGNSQETTSERLTKISTKETWVEKEHYMFSIKRVALWSKSVTARYL